MKIAVTYENGQVFQHFGHTEKFKIYEVENGAVKSQSIVDANGQGHSALVGILRDLDADVLICGGIGGGAKAALNNANIKLYGGVKGSCDDAVMTFVEGNLEYNPDVKCSHHESEHGDGEHACGEHGCGGHSCGGHCH